MKSLPSVEALLFLALFLPAGFFLNTLLETPDASSVHAVEHSTPEQMPSALPTQVEVRFSHPLARLRLMSISGETLWDATPQEESLAETEVMLPLTKDTLPDLELAFEVVDPNPERPFALTITLFPDGLPEVSTTIWAQRSDQRFLRFSH